jgi:predicted transcriptional regulator
MDKRMADSDLLALTADIVAAHVSNNTVAANEITQLIQNTFDALNKLGGPADVEAPAREPFVSIRSSIKPDYIVCLEDGKKLKMLKRYLASNFNLTPAEYRAKWKLPSDYPMTAPNYSEQRKGLALKSGLGRKAAERPQEGAPKRGGRKTANVSEAAPAKRRGRPRKVVAA